MIREAAVLFCFVALGCGSESATSPDGPGPTVIMTDKGAVEGTALAGTRTFLGIPFAAPPVGALRWKPPAEAAAWAGTKPAFEYGHSCPQIDGVTGKPSGDVIEDCLSLNVFTPLAIPSSDLKLRFTRKDDGFATTSGSYLAGCARSQCG